MDFAPQPSWDDLLGRQQNQLPSDELQSTRPRRESSTWDVEKDLSELNIDGACSWCAFARLLICCCILAAVVDGLRKEIFRPNKAAAKAQKKAKAAKAARAKATRAKQLKDAKRKVEEEAAAREAEKDRAKRDKVCYLTGMPAHC